MSCSIKDHKIKADLMDRALSCGIEHTAFYI